MKRTKSKNKIAWLMVCTLLFTIGVQMVRAEDDEHEDEKEQEHREQTQPESSDDRRIITQVDDPKPEFVVETVTSPGTPNVKTEVTRKVEQIIKPDTDGDGLIDEQDPHPGFAEIYIVLDENNNGIVDRYESLINNR